MFPKELLTATPESRLAYFKSKIISHPIITQIDKSLYLNIQEPADASLIMVYGPTGVGKTTLLHSIRNRIIKEALPEMEKNKGYIPVAMVEIVSPESGRFSWKGHYIHCMEALYEPLIEKKEVYNPHDLNQSLHRGARRSNLIELRTSLEKSLHNRGVKAFLYDESQHMFKMGSGERRLDQMDVIKSLANRTKTIHVLFGTYELIEMLSLSPQLCRRTIRIHFPRYLRVNPKDHEAFAKVLKTFQKHLPLKIEPDFIKIYDYLYEFSLGCVGLLKSWLVRALKLALDASDTRLKQKYLDQTKLPVFELRDMARDITRAETSHIQTEHDLAELRFLLDQEPQVKKSKAGSNSKPRTHSRKPGQRNPKRDPVDTDSNES